MGYTKYVDEGSRNPESTAYRSFISLLPPFILWNEWKTPGSISPMDRGFFLPFGRRGQCHKPFKVCSKAVHTFSVRVQYTMIVGRERHQPNRYPLFYIIMFSFFHLFFYPLFHFALACALFSISRFWKTGRFPCLRKKSAGNNSFTAYL